MSKYPGGKMYGYEMIPQAWSNEGPLSGVLNGDLVAYMRLDLEINWVFVNNHAFKCTYPGQSVQCSMCYSWEHRAGVCDRRGEPRRDLLRQYQSKWRRQVAYTARGVMEVPTTPKTGTTTATPTATGATSLIAISTATETSDSAPPATDPKTVLKLSDKASTLKEDEKGEKAETMPGPPKRVDSKITPKTPSLTKTPAGQGQVKPSKLNPDTTTKPSDTAKPQNQKEDKLTDKEFKPSGIKKNAYQTKRCLFHQVASQNNKDTNLGGN